MKKTITLTLVLFSFLYATAQENIPLLNGDIEDTTPLTPIDDNNFGIQGFRIFRSLVNHPNKLDVDNSGLAPGEGVGSSQALKGVTQNTAGNAGNVSLFSDLLDISNRGNGTYTFSFFVKTYVQPVNIRPLFIVVVGYDENDVKITNITAIDNGGTQNTTGITADFVEQSITVDLNDTSIKKLSLQVQFAKEDNTFLFDNFTLTGPAATLGLNDNKIDSKIHIYPNPVKSTFVLKSKNGINEVSVLSITGALVKQVKTDGRNEYNLDITNLKSGMYIVSVKNSKGTFNTKISKI